MAKLIYVKPITLKKANEFIGINHRHHRPTSRNSGRWAIAGYETSSDKMIGVVIAGNPVSATYMDGLTIELTRVCVLEEAPKGTCSFLISRCCAIWKMMGGSKAITYTLESESGASLRGAGWRLTGTVAPPQRWENKSKVDGIIRDKLELYSFKKLRWERVLQEA
ncbi:XF1762 family protein [Serratia marcescens]|uniref:XF1762 family protein n=1 Tax=Serratia marcescens TaxID=615 RepID=UPI002FD8B014